MALASKTKTISAAKIASSRKRPFKLSGNIKGAVLSKKRHGRLAGYRLAKTPVGAGISVGAIRQKFGVSQEELARVTGYSTRSIAGWESGQALSVAARQKLTEAERLRAALAEIMPPDSLGEWLRTP